jgi:hypothetical protein
MTRSPASFPAKINLLVPIGTLLGWSDIPGEADRDIIGPHALRDLVQASSRHPATRWCVTIVDVDGAASGPARLISAQNSLSPGSAMITWPTSGRRPLAMVARSRISLAISLSCVRPR